MVGWIKRTLGAGVLLLLGNASVAGMSTNGFFPVEDVLVWADYSNGAFRVSLEAQDENANALCPAGYWLDGSNDKNSSVLSVVLSAYHAQSKIRVYADENDDFPGMASKECKIRAVMME